jgi:hypothetical protein
MRKRRLGDVQLLGGTGEVAVAGNRFDVSELAQLHESPFTINRESRWIR